jgi:hypothetical protein
LAARLAPKETEPEIKKHRKVTKERKPKVIMKKHLLVFTAANPRIPTKIVERVRAMRA